jgi:FkbM family methyltransferase
MPVVGDFLYKAKHIYKYYVSQDFGEMNSGELAVLNAIKSDISNLFDVGARFNTDYADSCKYLDIELHLFEPNPLFYGKLERKLGNRPRVHLHNIGLSDKVGELTYYKDTQSFVKTHHMMESKVPGQKLLVETLDEFCLKNKFEHIDFLKIDVESLDFHVLLGGSSIIQNTCKYCQVEIGIGAPLGSAKVTTQHYVDFFSKNFNLYFVRDEDHPICKDNQNLPIISLFEGSLREKIEIYLDQGYGPNLLAIRRDVALSQAVLNIMKV